MKLYPLFGVVMLAVVGCNNNTTDTATTAPPPLPPQFLYALLPLSCLTSLLLF